MANGHLLRTAAGSLYRQARTWDGWPSSLASGFNFRPRYAPSGVVGTPYLFTITGVCYTGWFPGGWPPGLLFHTSDTGGYLHGTPTAAGSWILQVEESALTSYGMRKYTITVGAAAPSNILITTVALPNVVYGASYTVQMAATGGTTSYTWSVASGSFPSGISMSSAGLISGSSTAAAGAYSVTLRCSDTSSQTTTKQFNFSMLANTSNVIFTIETGTQYNETNMLFVYDPAGYGYCAADGASGGYYPSGYFPYPGTSMPLGRGVVYYHQYPANPVSPNGGYSTAYRAETPYDQSVKWQSGASPSGIYKFWCERTNGATMGALAFRYRIYVGGSLFWEISGSGTALYSSSRRYTQLWTYNTATGVVS